MNEVIERAEARQLEAEAILRELDLVRRWNRFGTCEIVGAVAYRLVVAPDIDMEIRCPEPKIEDGFEVLRDCALHPSVTKTRYQNALGPPHHGLYWQVRYLRDGVEWKVDMWSLAGAYRGPSGRRLTEPMLAALTDESRERILSLKEAVLRSSSVECPSIQIYRAVLDGEVRTPEGLEEWLVLHPLADVVTDWMP